MNQTDMETFPCPALWASRSGKLSGLSNSLRSLLDFFEPPEQLINRFSLRDLSGRELSLSEMPWLAVGDGQEKELQQAWYDKKLNRVIFLHLRKQVFQDQNCLLIQEETTKGLELASGLGSLASTLLRTGDPASVSRLLVKQVSQLLRADVVYLAKTQEGENQLTMLASRGLPPALQAAWSKIPFDSPFITAKAARTKEIQQISDIQELSKQVHLPINELHAIGMCAFIAIPLLAANELFGVLVIARRYPGYLGIQELQVMSVVTSAVAIALRQQATLQSERTAVSSLQTIWSALETITPDLPFKELLYRIAQKANELLNAEYSAVGILKPDENGFAEWIGAGSLPGYIGSKDRLLDNNLLRDVLNNPRPVKATSATDIDNPESGTTSILVAPLQLRHHQMLGIVCIAGKQTAPEFSETDLRLLELFSDRTALTIDYARTTDQLQEQNSRYRAVLQSIPSAVVFAQKKEAQVIRANPAAEDLFGQHFGGETVETFENRYQFLDSEGHPLERSDRPFWRALTKGERTTTREVRIVRPDSSEIPAWISAAPWTSAKGDIIGAVMTVRDISAIKDLDRLREEFAAIIAHDLRNPIQAIMMQSEFLTWKAHGDSVSVPVAALNQINRNARNLAEMTNDLLDASRLETHRVLLDRKDIAPAKSLSELIERIRPTLGSHPVRLNIEGSPGNISGDPLRFDQIFTNLIENAVKYSDPATPIEITIKNHQEGVLVAIQDQGMGISQQDIPHLFDRFFQAKRARQKKSGLGLGLYITKGLIQAHGGNISVASSPGKGSRFSVWLPFEATGPMMKAS